MKLLSRNLNNILHSYLGVVVVQEAEPYRNILKNSIWLSETKNLVGLIAFTEWSIPKKEAFRYCRSLKYIIGIPPTLGTNMSYMFWEATSFNQPLEQWDVSSVNDMSWMFEGATLFNQPLEQWDVSSVSDMRGMFWAATSFNQPLEQWDVSNAKNMDSMFNGATSLSKQLSWYKQ